MASKSHVCGPCKDYNKVAFVYCTVCEQALCEECKGEHGLVKILKTHGLRCIEELPPTEIADLLKSLIVCPNHDNEEVVYLCQDHEATCCSKCAMANHRKCDEVRLLADMRPNLNSEGVGLKNIIQELNTKGQLLLEHEIAYKGLIQDTELRANVLLKNIKDKLLMAFANLEHDVLSAIAEKKERLLINMEKQTACLQTFLIEVQSQSHMLEQVETFGSNVHAILMERKLQQEALINLTKVAKDLEHTQSKAGFTCIESGSFEQSIKEVRNALHIDGAIHDEDADTSSDVIQIERKLRQEAVINLTEVANDLEQIRSNAGCTGIDSGSFAKSIKEVRNAFHIDDTIYDESAATSSDAYIDTDRLVQCRETLRKTLHNVQSKAIYDCNDNEAMVVVMDTHCFILINKLVAVVIFYDSENSLLTSLNCQCKPWSFSETGQNEIVVYMPDLNGIECSDVKFSTVRFVEKGS